MLAQMQGTNLQITRKLGVLVGEEVGAHRWEGDGQCLQLWAVAEGIAEMLTVAWGTRMRVPEAILGPRAVLQNAECLARSLDNRHDTINGD